ncbi:MAG TPA: hypothetical protein VLV83_21970 [Acidobacteriota bacterium]|nr:hypothetical protein [Acidobacteriota bacterium]
MDCRYSQDIAPYLMDDLPDAQRRKLSRHLQQCDICRREKAALEQTFAALGEVQDVPIPHHFFVARDDSRLGLLQAWRRLSALWKAGLAGALAMLLTVAGLSASGFQIEVDQGIVRAGFGPFPSLSPAVSEGQLRVLSDQVLVQVRDKLATRDEAMAGLIREVRLLDQRLQGLDQTQLRRLHAVAADLESQLSQAWRQDDQQALQEVEQWMAQTYADLRLDYLRRLSVVDANLEQFAQRDSALNQQVSFLGEALVYTLDQRQPEKISQ